MQVAEAKVREENFQKMNENILGALNSVSEEPNLVFKYFFLNFKFFFNIKN